MKGDCEGQQTDSVGAEVQAHIERTPNLTNKRVGSSWVGKNKRYRVNLSKDCKVFDKFQEAEVKLSLSPGILAQSRSEPRR